MLRMMDGLTEEAQAFARPEAVRAMGELVLVELEANVRFHRDLFPLSLCVSASPPNTHTHTHTLLASLPTAKGSVLCPS
jgi:hypothetical protein